MTAIACTVSSEKIASAIMGGYFLQVNLGSLKPLKGAFEGFCLDERNVHPLSPVLYMLTHLYSLGLSHLPLTLYVTSSEALQLLQNLSSQKDIIAQAVAFLLSYFPQTTFIPCFEGFFFEKMRSRLKQLCYEQINEVIALDFKVLADYLLADPL
jgi:hypothetical protein